MKTKHKVALALLWGATCVACLGIGYAMRGEPPPREITGDPNAAEVIPLPPRHLTAVIVDKGLGTQVNITRQERTPQFIRAVKVWPGKEGVLSASFFGQSGIVQTIEIKKGKRYLRDWGFRQDGSIEYATTYEQDGIENQGTRQYFDDKGKPTHSGPIKIHHG